jgi:hypothetical protein
LSSSSNARSLSAAQSIATPEVSPNNNDMPVIFSNIYGDKPLLPRSIKLHHAITQPLVKGRLSRRYLYVCPVFGLMGCMTLFAVWRRRHDSSRRGVEK